MTLLRRILSEQQAKGFVQTDKKDILILWPNYEFFKCLFVCCIISMFYLGIFPFDIIFPEMSNHYDKGNVKPRNYVTSYCIIKPYFYAIN